MCTTIISTHLCGQHIGPVNVVRCFYYKSARTLVPSVDLAFRRPNIREKSELAMLERGCKQDTYEQRLCEYISACPVCVLMHAQIGLAETAHRCAYPQHQTGLCNTKLKPV
jgi:hypothetical protein